MNQSEQKQSGPSILMLVVLIAALVVGVKVIFSGLEIIAPPPKADPHRVVDVTTGAKSPWQLTIGPDREASQVDQWLEKCGADQGFYGLMETSPNSWEAYFYLPGVEQKLTNENISLEIVTQEENTILTIYINTVGLEEKTDPKEQLLAFLPPAGEKWPNSLAVVLNGAPLEQAGQCISNGGQMYWAE